MNAVTPATEETIARAAGLISTGEVVAFPTETVYGLGADAGNDRAVAAVYAIKRRPVDNPLIVHCASLEQVFSIAESTPVARKLAEAFWPGALTMILTARREAAVCCRVRSGLDTIAVRIPAHPVALALIAGAGSAIAAPSANPSGRVSPTTAWHVADDLGDGVAMILDGGASAGGIESSIVDARSGRVSLLRVGGITRERIEAETGSLESELPTSPMTPGRGFCHYAPSVPLKLNMVFPPPDGYSCLGFALSPEQGAPDVLDLSPSGDLDQAAANLFAMLRQLERLGRPICVAPIPSTGVGEAINDRLERAAGAKK